MARYEFKLPDIGEGVTEGEIVEWLVAVGDVVVEDQPMVEVMTDKATVTITAPKAGTIAELRGKAGQVIPVHAVLVVFELGSGEGAAAGHAPPAGDAAKPAKKDDGPAATAVGDIKEDLPGMSLLGGAGGAAAPAPAPRAAAPTYFREKPLATPATRKLARELGVDLRTVPPTGPSGRVTKADVRGTHDAASGGAPARGAHEAPVEATADRKSVV